MRTIRTKIYTFNELPETAKKVAIDKFRAERFTELYGFEEMCKERCLEQGFKEAEIRYSLSYSQGDGLSFDAYLDIRKLILEAKPEIKNSVLSVIVEYVSCTCTSNKGRYAYASNDDVYFSLDEPYTGKRHPNLEKYVAEIECFISEKYVSLCKNLEVDGYADIEYQQSDECIIENILGNENEYTEKGELWNG